ncbi:MAG: threonine/serine exporter family protein [Acetatifactor sp.]
MKNQEDCCRSEHGAILHELLNIGEMMLANGAEIKRVEDTLERMGSACGAKRMNVFVITSSIVVTMLFEDGEEVTQTRRIVKPAGTDFRKLEDLNELSRSFCANPLTSEQLHSEVEKLVQKKDHYRLKRYLGSVLAAGGFAVFFGGSLWDGLAAAVFAAFVCLMQRYLDPFCTNRVVFNVICSFLTGVGICLAAGWIPVLNADKIMIGDIMLLIPGIALTNSVRDILVGDTISGVMRLIEALLWAGALACGFMAAIWVVM